MRGKVAQPANRRRSDMMGKGYKQLLDEANAVVEAVPPADALAMPDREDVLFVDLRDPRELDRDGKIPGAFHCPRGMLEFWIDPESLYHKPQCASGNAFVFYCASGWRSALAGRTVIEMGLAGVRHLQGGITHGKKPVEWSRQAAASEPFRDEAAPCQRRQFTSASAASIRSRARLGSLPSCRASRFEASSPTCTTITMPIARCGVHLMP